MLTWVSKCSRGTYCCSFSCFSPPTCLKPLSAIHLAGTPDNKFLKLCIDPAVPPPKCYMLLILSLLSPLRALQPNILTECVKKPSFSLPPSHLHRYSIYLLDLYYSSYFLQGVGILHKFGIAAVPTQSKRNGNFPPHSRLYCRIYTTKISGTDMGYLVARIWHMC